MKSLLYRLFGLGKLPSKAASALHAEGVVMQDEGISGTLIFKRFKAPGRRYHYKKTGFSGSLMLTQERLIVFVFSKPIINVKLNDGSVQSLDLSCPRENTLEIRFDAGAFDASRSGEITCRLRTIWANLFLEHLRPYLSSSSV